MTEVLGTMFMPSENVVVTCPCFSQEVFMKGRLKVHVESTSWMHKRRVGRFEKHLKRKQLLYKLVRYVIVCDCLSNAAENKSNQQVWLIGDLALSRCYPGPCLHVFLNSTSTSSSLNHVQGDNNFKGL